MKTITWMGGVADSTTTASKTANVRAITDYQKKFPGSTMQIPPGTFHFNNNVVIKTPITIIGEGFYGSSIFSFDDGYGIIVEPGGDWSTFKSIRVESKEGWSLIEDGTASRSMRPADSAVQTNTNGFTLKARAVLENVFISGFGGNGVYGIANAQLGTNTNSTQIIGGRFEELGRCGIITGGGDGNAWGVRGTEIVSVGEHGVYDRSMAGGCYIGVQVSGAMGRSYFFENGQTVAIGCYAEGDSLLALIQAPAMWMGTSMIDPESTGYIINAYWSQNTRAMSPGQGIEITIANSDQTAWTWKTKDDPYFHSLDWSKDEFAWVQHWAGSWRSIYYTGAIGDRQHPRGAGKFGATEMLLGEPLDAIKITVGDDLPDLSTAEPGDIHHIRNPKLGRPSSWRCCLNDNNEKVWGVDSQVVK